MNFTYTLQKSAGAKRIVYFQFNNVDTISRKLIDVKINIKKNQCQQIHKNKILYFHSRLENNHDVKSIIGFADLMFFVIHVCSEQIKYLEKRILELKKILNFKDTTFFIVIDIMNCPLRTSDFLIFAFSALHQAFESLDLKIHNILFTTTKSFINQKELSQMPFVLSINFVRNIVYSTKKMTHKRNQLVYEHYVQYFGNLSVLSQTLIQKTIKDGIILYLGNKILCANEQIILTNKQQTTRDVILRFYTHNQSLYS